MDEKTRRTIQAVLNTLDQISISGAANIDRMYGVIITLRQLIQPPAEKQETEED